ncbi:GNAT family N-acetyltransferase [Streptomyces sp. NPDC057877]|uniref:GNAT family N-acetyltransferase n=1 Tax=Streptomyces sp. NPDC057877 TaxID=3346269 RepID=UPI0036946EE8
MENVVRAWVDGWVVSRGAAPPQVEPWGWTIDVGQTEHVTRHVLAATDDVQEETVRKVAASVTGTGVWLKVFEDPTRTAGWLGDGWWTDPEPGYLMTLRLPTPTPAAPSVPEGFRLRVWTRGGVTRVLLAAPDGSLAARGQLATTGATAVVDQMETAPSHRRKGLGAQVMRTLHHSAAEQGAETAVLAGTPAGRALYEHLGWRVTAPLTSAKFTGRT